MGTVSENVYAFNEVGGLGLGVVDPVTVASANDMPAPRARISTVSGSTQINTIALPWPGFTGSISYIPTGAFTGATGGSATDTKKAVGKAFTAVVGKVLTLTFDGTLWYPDYTS